MHNLLIYTHTHKKFFQFLRSCSCTVVYTPSVATYTLNANWKFFVIQLHLRVHLTTIINKIILIIFTYFFFFGRGVCIDMSYVCIFLKCSGFISHVNSYMTPHLLAKDAFFLIAKNRLILGSTRAYNYDENAQVNIKNKFADLPKCETANSFKYSNF